MGSGGSEKTGAHTFGLGMYRWRREPKSRAFGQSGTTYMH
jgi:hypothetical protein